MIAAGAPVAVGISGGKDSCAVAIAVAELLAARGHRGPKILIHADLGLVEWMDSGSTCVRLSTLLKARHGQDNWDLVVTRRQRGGMMERWEERWAESQRRYEELECVKIILPWSTPSMRFCTAELKRDPITAMLKRMFKGPVLSVSGIRAEESPRRAKMPPSKPGSKLRAGSVDWNAILRWRLEDVWRRCAGFKMHEAYAMGSTRVSCVWCIMGSENDFAVALSDRRYDPLYRRMTNLELASGFAFQGGKWLSDLAPDRIQGGANRILAAKELAARREEIESVIPEHLLYVKGWPVAVPTDAEAQLLAEARQRALLIYDWQSRYVDSASIQNRYRELMAENAAREAKKAKIR